MFYIRADANEQIATGHIMRCMSIATELKKRGVDTTFITADHFADELIHARGFETMCLESNWENMEEELGVLMQYIQKNNIEKLLIDSYAVSSRYFSELQKQVKVYYLDDLGGVTKPIDMLINYNVYADSLAYAQLRDNDRTKLLLGTQYAPLREEFQHIIPSFRDTVTKVFISTGGADLHNIAGQLVDRIVMHREWDKIEFHVISGSLNKNLPKLLALSSEHDNIFIHQNVMCMSEIMCQCDIAISACGSTMYELCACGLSIITFSFADNQLPGVKGFEEKGLAINCGDSRESMEALIEHICANLSYLIQRTDIRRKMSERAKVIVDGKGVSRLVDALLGS